MALRDLGNWFYKKLDSGNKYAADMAERQYQQVVDQRVRDLQAQSRANPATRQANSARIAAIGANAQVKPNQTMAQMQDIYGGSAEQDFYQNFGAGVMKYWSPQSIAGSALEQTGRLLNNRTIKNAGTRLAQPVRDYSQTMAGVAQDSALSELAGNLGQVSGAMLPAMLTPTTVVQGTGRLAPAALALSPQAATAARVASLINRGGVVARTGVIGGADVSQAIEQSGGSRAKQLIGGGIVGAVTGGLNAAATDALTGKVVGRLGQNAGTRMFNSGVANAAENVGDQLVQNYVAQKTYDPNRQLTDQMGQNIGTGFIFGAGMRGVGEYANARVPGNQRGSIEGPRPESVTGNIRNLTTGLEALQYPTFEGFYNDYKSFFDDMGFNADQAREVYIAGQGAKVIPSGQTGTRASASAQSDFELAYNSGNKAKALEAAQQIADPTAKRAALQALGQDVSTLPVAEGVTNPTVKAMMEAAAKRKAEAANQQPAPKTSLFGDERGSIAVVDEPKPKTQQPITVSSKKTEVKLNANRLDLPKSVKAKITKETTQLIDTMSNKEVMDLAKRSGMDTKTYSDAQVRQQIAEQLNVRRGAVELERQAMAMRKEGANPDEIAKIIMQARELENTSREQGTGIARQLQARRIIADEMKTPMQRVMMLLDKAGVNPEVAAKRLATVDFDDSNQVVAAYRELVPAKPGEWLDTLRYNSMLSSPLTHIINISSNLTNAAVVAPIEKTIAGALDAVFHPGKRTKFAGEGAAYLKGAASAIPQAGQKFIDVMRGKQSATNLDLRDNVPLATTGPAANIGTALNYPMRLLEASDQFFTTLVRAGEMSDIDMKQKRGVTIKNADNVADANAAYRLFRQRPGDASQGTVLQTIDGFTNMLLQARSGRFGKGVATISRWTLPFVQTPMNIFKQGVEYSPAGFTTMIGAADPTTQAAKAIMGSTVFMGVSTLLGAGRLTWAEPTNPDEKDRFRAEGKQPYAVKIGDTWINFSKLAPTVAFPFAAVASINDSFEKGKMDESTFDKVVGGIAKYGNFMADQSYVKTVGDLLASVKGDAEDFARAAANYPQQVIPMRAFTGWLARMTDDTERKLDGGFIDKQVQSFMQQYPGLRQGTPERTANGQPIPANNPVINAFSPARVTTAREGVAVGSSGSTGVTITGDKKTANVEIKALRDRAMPGDYGLTQVSDGRYAATINGEVKAYDSLDKARLDMAKSRFADTGQETQEWRDKLFIRNEDGSVKVDDKIVYDYRQIDSQLSLAKSYGDINTWNQLAQAKLQNLMEQRGRLNPRTQGDKIAKIDRDIYELKKTSIKYAQQGGFSGRGRSGKRSLPNVDTSVSFGGPVVARSSYRAPGVKLSKRGGLPIGPSRRVQITAPKKLA